MRRLKSEFLLRLRCEYLWKFDFWLPKISQNDAKFRRGCRFLFTMVTTSVLWQTQKFEFIIFSSMQLNDTRIQEYGRNDGVHSIFHCQDKFYISFYKIYALTRFLSDILQSWCQHWLWIKLKHLCFLNQECDGFTLSGKLNCILHRTAATFHFTGRKISQVGIRNRTSTFSKYCQEELRLKRCKNEPKCKNVLNCFRQGYQRVRRIQPSYWP